jgi:hypothetical protein
MLRYTLLMRIGKWRSHEEAIMTVLDLLNSVSVVIPGGTPTLAF